MIVKTHLQVSYVHFEGFDLLNVTSIRSLETGSLLLTFYVLFNLTF